MIWLELYGLTAAAGTAFFASSSRPRPKSTFVANLVFFSAGVRGLRCCGFVIGEQYCVELLFPLRIGLGLTGAQVFAMSSNARPVQPGS